MPLWPEWSCTENQVRSQGHMDCAEPLILEYELRNWMNNDYRGNDKMRLAQPDVKDSYRGYVRNKVGSIPAYMVSGDCLLYTSVHRGERAACTAGSGLCRWGAGT